MRNPLACIGHPPANDGPWLPPAKARRLCNRALLVLKNSILVSLAFSTSTNTRPKALAVAAVPVTGTKKLMFATLLPAVAKSLDGLKVYRSPENPNSGVLRSELTRKRVPGVLKLLHCLRAAGVAGSNPAPPTGQVVSDKEPTRADSQPKA